MQAGVFFGRDRYLGLQVVCKQFKMKNYRGLLRELKMFSLLEEKRRKDTQKAGTKCDDQADLSAIMKSGQQNDSLPRLLAYKMGDTVAEVLMTNDGSNLEKWYLKI